MAIVNISKNTVLAKKVIVADDFYSRLKGLLGRNSIGQEEALVIRPANSIHTLFMRFSIDVLFVDKENKVIGLRECLEPFMITPIFLNSRLVIELSSQTIQKTQTQIGDILEIA